MALTGFGRALARFDGRWHELQTRQGLYVHHLPLKSDERFVIFAQCRVGTRFDPPDRVGLSHFLEHCLFRGSRRYPDYFRLASAFESLGGEWNAATSHERTELWFVTHKRQARKALQIFADFLAHPTFPDIAIEKKIVQQEIQGDLNEYQLNTDLSLHVAELLWPGHPLAHPILGTAESLTRMSESDLRQHHQNFFTCNNLALGIAGGPWNDALQKVIVDAFQLPAAAQGTITSPVPSAAKGPQVRVVNNSDSQYQLQLSFATGGEWAADALFVELIARVLADGFSARLSKKLREERGLVYEIQADATSYTDAGTLNIQASVSPENLMPLLNGLVTELARFAQDGPTEAELRRTQNRWLVDLTLQLAEPLGMLTEYCWNRLHEKSGGLAAKGELIAAMTPASVQAMAAEILRPTRLALAVLGPDEAGLKAKIQAALAESAWKVSLN